MKVIWKLYHEINEKSFSGLFSFLIKSFFFFALRASLQDFKLNFLKSLF